MTDNPIEKVEQAAQAAVNVALATPKEVSPYEEAANRWRKRGDELEERGKEAKTECYKIADGLLDYHNKTEEFYKGEKQRLDQVFDHIHAAPTYNGSK